MVECLSDNTNRTAGDIRSYFTKNGGNLGVSGSVNYLFEKLGVLVIERTENIDEDQLMQKIVAVAAFNGGSYVNPRFPIGVIEKGKPEMPYDEDIDVMKDALLALQPADTFDNIGTAVVKIVGIKVFTGNDGKLYWVAVAAEGKK